MALALPLLVKSGEPSTRLSESVETIFINDDHKTRLSFSRAALMRKKSKQLAQTRVAVTCPVSEVEAE